MARKLLTLAVVVWAAVAFWPQHVIYSAPGVIAPLVPIQGSPGGAPIRYGDYTLTPLASFQLEARVLSREGYRFGREADLSPLDIAFGWGRMSDTSVLEQLDINQRGRFYYYRWGSEGPPIPAREIVESSANMHLIPANDTVADRMDDAREGHVVRLSGKLVRADAPDGWRWISSTTRGDSGAGACEVIYVESFEIVPRRES